VPVADLSRDRQRLLMTGNGLIEPPHLLVGVAEAGQRVAFGGCIPCVAGGGYCGLADG
jgi:hypothetical protein